MSGTRNRDEGILGNRASVLTERQKVIAGLCARGKQAKDIAVLLNISERTAEWHIRRVREKMGANSMVHAVAVAMSSGEIAMIPGDELPTPRTSFTARPKTAHLKRRPVWEIEREKERLRDAQP